MNFYYFYISRIFAVAASMLVILIIQSVGLGLHERRHLADYQNLGAQVSDDAMAHVEWILWPPQAMVVGSFQGHSFRYMKVRSRYSHLLLECQPNQPFELSQRRRAQPSFMAKGPHAFLPGWMTINAFTSPVPWSKRSMDRRPLGFGRAPGMDLYRQDGGSFSPEFVRSDLENLAGYCTPS